jgi:hypothetical protein
MDEIVENEKERGVGFPQVIHDRARTAATNLHKFLLSLSTGSVGIFFIAVTTKIDPQLTIYQQVAILVGLAAMGIATELVFGHPMVTFSAIILGQWPYKPSQLKKKRTDFE